jgi:methyl-accepting chemotaxis protein
VAPIAFASLASYCSFIYPGLARTRRLNAVCQALLTVLFINLSAGHPQSHYLIFISISILSFYLDWQVVCIGSATISLLLALLALVSPEHIFASGQMTIWLELACIAVLTLLVGFFNHRCQQEIWNTTRRQTLSEFANAKKIASKSKAEADLAQQQTAVSRVVEKLQVSAEHVSAVLKLLSESAQQTLVAVVETTNVSEEVRQTAEISMAKAKQVASDSQSVLHISEIGKEATGQAVEGMKRIRQQMTAIGDSMVKLSDQGKTIGEIIATVDDLAQQTSLLSVNASIEASKAGEQGKGFAVVAQEVKELAVQSKEATKRVRAILNEIANAATNATLTTELGHKAVSSGEDVVGQSKDAILRLAQSVIQAAQAGKQIEISNQQQLVGMQQVVNAMEGLRDAGNQTVKRIKDIEQYVFELNSAGQQLNSMLDNSRLAQYADSAADIEVVLAN